MFRTIWVVVAGTASASLDFLADTDGHALLLSLLLLLLLLPLLLGVVLVLVLLVLLLLGLGPLSLLLQLSRVERLGAVGR